MEDPFCFELTSALARHLAAGAASLGEADGYSLLAAPHLLPAFSHRERAAFVFMQRLLHLPLCRFSVTCHIP